jgi:hypothetical protein
LAGHAQIRIVLAISAGSLLLASRVAAQQLTTKVVTLADDTPVHMFLKDDLSSKTNNVDDPVHFQVRQDILVDGIVAIPVGTQVRGHVIEVSHRGFAGHSGRLRFAVDSLTAPDGTIVLLRGSPQFKGDSVGKVVAGATAMYGPGALLMRGSQAEIHAGLILNAYVSGDRKITVKIPVFGAAAPTTTQAAPVSSPTTPALQHRPTEEPAPNAPPLTATPPAIVMVDPSVPASGGTVKLSSSPLTIRGVVIDSAGLARVTVNGAPAMLKPRSEQSAEFQSDPATLHPGANKFEIIASNAARTEAKVSFVAYFSPPGPAAPPPTQAVANPKSLSEDEIVNLLKNDVSSARVAELVKQFGLRFTPSEDDLSNIRQAGGDDDLLRVIQETASAPH